jgi:hypothetical protein
MRGTCIKIKSSQYVPSKHRELLTGPRRPEFSYVDHIIVQQRNLFHISLK